MNCESEWLAEARRQYGTPDHVSVRAETNFGRANQVTKLLEKKILPVTTQPSILLVGIGILGDRFSNPLECTYTPFVTAAFLESKGIHYRLVLVDIINSIIEDVKQREHLYITADHLRDYKGTETDWKKYLELTKQPDRIIHTQEDGLAFIDRPEFAPKSYLRSGIHVAKIPSQFKNKIKSGEISLIKGDIATVDLSAFPKFDLVDCANVLYHLPTAGQMMALSSIGRSTNKGGLILVNDFGNYDDRTPLFSELGGWLSKERLEELGLVVDKSTKAQKKIPDGRYEDIVTVIRALLKKI